MKALTPREEIFVTQYMLHFNKTRACEGLYPATLTRHQMTIRGNRMWNRPQVRAAVKLRLEERLMTKEELLDRWSEQCRAEYTQYILPDGTVDIQRVIAEGKTHLIKRIKHTMHGIDVEFYDAQRAQELLGKYFGILEDNLRVKEAVVVNVRYADDIEPDMPNVNDPIIETFEDQFEIEGEEEPDGEDLPDDLELDEDDKLL